MSCSAETQTVPLVSHAAAVGVLRPPSVSLSQLESDVLNKAVLPSGWRSKVNGAVSAICHILELPQAQTLGVVTPKTETPVGPVNEPCEISVPGWNSKTRIKVFVLSATAICACSK